MQVCLPQTIPSSGRGFSNAHAVRKFNFVTQPVKSVRTESNHTRFICQSQGWFDFSSDLSQGIKPELNIEDLKVLSHLKALGCGDLVSKPETVHFRGCINESYTFNCTAGRFFVKINRSLKSSDMFEGEFEALENLKLAGGVQVPHPLGFGDLPAGGSYIILEHMQFRPFGMMRKASQESLGRSLAKLHQFDTGDMFGFPRNTRLGYVPLENTWTRSWKTFFVENRLKDRMKRVYAVLGVNASQLQSKEAALFSRVAEILDSHDCKPCLLHGDLWMGNTGLVANGEVAMFDPAAFIGDAEFDLAFRDWLPVPGFPGFSDAFYESYHGVLPRTHGFAGRHNVYQLFHLLNHLIMYGLEYYSHVIKMVDHIIEMDHLSDVV